VATGVHSDNFKLAVQRGRPEQRPET